MRAGILVALAALVAVTAISASMLGGSTPDPVLAADGSMAVDCDASTGVIDTNCSYDVGETFDISVHATGGDFSGYQVKPRWADAVLDYLPAADPATENQWPVTCMTARFDNQPGDPSVLFGCGAFPPVTSTYAGVLVLFEMSCDAAGATALTLVPRAGDAQQGTHFADILGDAIDTAVFDAGVTCNAVGTGTPTNTPTSTPAGQPGDVDCNGRVDAIDAALVLQLDAAFIGLLACQELADLNGDGLIDATDALFVLWIAAGLV